MLFTNEFLVSLSRSAMILHYSSLRQGFGDLESVNVVDDGHWEVRRAVRVNLVRSQASRGGVKHVVPVRKLHVEEEVHIPVALAFIDYRVFGTSDTTVAVG